MFRWLIRFSVAALIGALLVWLWNRYNQDLLEEELEDEIPLEFDVPAQAEALPGPAPSASADTSAAGKSAPATSAGANDGHADSAVEGPPAMPATAPASITPEGAAASADTAAAKAGAGSSAPNLAAAEAEEEGSAENPAPVLDSPAPTPAGAGDNVIVIKGIGPKYGAKLAEMGITTFGALLATPLDTLALAFPRVSEAELQNWLEQARELATQSNETT
jgi:predicted flap endonuclease-1-like 5' DNA nuclease